MADVVVGFLLDGKTPADVEALLADPAVRFDYYCWDLYARISAQYAGNQDLLAKRAEVLHAIEAGSGAIADLAHLVADNIVKAHLATMLRLDVEYDVLPRESEILHLKFWAHAFELLKERKAIYLETDGKNAGCWVMPGPPKKAKSSSAPTAPSPTSAKTSPTSSGSSASSARTSSTSLSKPTPMAASSG